MEALSSWAFAYCCCPLVTGRFSSSAGQVRAQMGGVMGGLLTLPRPSSAVRYDPSLQVDRSCSSAGVAVEEHQCECLAVNLAVKSRSINARTPSWWGLADQRRRVL
jgi:hypothetical protein